MVSCLSLAEVDMKVVKACSGKAGKRGFGGVVWCGEESSAEERQGSVWGG